MDKLLGLIDKDARITNAQIGVMLGIPEDEAAAQLEKLEKDGIIKGYKAIIDWDKTKRDYVMARIEVKVSPKKGYGFEEIAETIMGFEEVETVYLMSGSYDLALSVSGKSFKDIAFFVAQKLAPLDSVLSTSTSFVLRKYKERGIPVVLEEKDEREESAI